MVETVRLQVFGETPVTPIVEPVVTALAARTSLDVARADELIAAIDLVRNAWRGPDPLSVTLAAVGDTLTVELTPVAPAVLAQSESLVSRLVTSISTTNDAVTLRVDR